MTDLDLKKELIHRIAKYDPALDVNTLIQKPLAELEELLGTLIEQSAADMVESHRIETGKQSAMEQAYVHALRNVTLNGKRLVDCDSNRVGLENSLQPHEEASGSLYATIALTYPGNFSWQVPPPVKTAADQEAEFVKMCHENLLSLCDANRQMFKDGVALENFAGESGIERAARQAQQAQERQTYLIKTASPSELRNEAKYQSATEREIALKAESDRQHAFVSQAQAGLYSPLPSHNQAGEAMDAKYFRRLSTLDYPLFRQLVKKFGTSQITERLRQPAAPTV